MTSDIRRRQGASPTADETKTVSGPVPAAPTSAPRAVLEVRIGDKWVPVRSITSLARR